MNSDTRALKRRWEQLTEQINAACRATGRNPGEVTALPVSKNFPPETIRAAIGLGLHRFGENRAQEMRDKSRVLGTCGIDWVMIGHVQTNKIGIVARLASEVQSLDRPELAVALDRRLQQEQRMIDVLVQVKTAGEPSKHGLNPQELLPCLEELRACPTLRVRGLMTVAAHTGNPEIVRGCFRKLRQLRAEAAAHGHDLARLSMGMSDDFMLAIAEGATEIRVGTALFGPRPTFTTHGRPV